MASRTSTSESDHSVHDEVQQTKEMERGTSLALQKTTSEPVYPPTSKVVVIMFAIFLSIFLVALDRLIIGTAIPTITKDFNSLDDIGWYASAYLLTCCCFVLLMGRIYTFYNPKWVFLINIVIFEIGSAVCGAAPNSTALIIGRAIAGVGNAGIFQGAVVIIFQILPLHKRPMWMGFIGMVFGIASAVGPLLGGAFTDSVSWRWCFYINLPIGAVTMVILIFVLKVDNMTQSKAKTLREKASQLDPFGSGVFLPCVICLLLALQWGGISYAWSNYRIIITLVFFAVLLVVFVIIQYFKGPYATVPGNIVRNRSVLAASLFSFCNGGSMMVMFYFLPIWFQAIKGASAVKSGIMNLPMILALVIASISAGIITKKVGYYAPQMIASAIIAPIGAGLISTFTPSTGHAKWIGFQVIYGFGIGIGMQQPNVAVQTVLSRKDVATGASLMFFFQTLGGAVFSSVGNNLFNSKLVSGLSSIPGINIAQIINVGATQLNHVVPPEKLGPVAAVYNQALVDAFYLAVATTSLSILGAAAIEWKSVKQQKKPGQPTVAAAETQAPDTTKDLEKA